MDTVKEFVLIVVALVAVIATAVTVLALVGYFSGNVNALEILFISSPISVVSLIVTLRFKDGWLRLISWLV